MVVPQSEHDPDPPSALFGFVPRSATTILDVGCGTGAIGALLKSRGAEVWGVEVAATAEAATTRLDRVIRRPIEAAGELIPNGHFDCVLFHDVLEHLVDPWSVLRAARAWLTPNGCVVASIPNMRHLQELMGLVFAKNWDY